MDFIQLLPFMRFMFLTGLKHFFMEKLQLSITEKLINFVSNLGSSSCFIASGHVTHFMRTIIK